MNKKKFTRAKNLVSVGAFLIALLAFVSPLPSDALPVVKAPQGDFKVRPFYSLDYPPDPKWRFDDRFWDESYSDISYALDDLALKFIRDPEIRWIIGSVYWCGTPTGMYLGMYGEPPEAYLRKRAARMEAEYLSLLDKRYLLQYLTITQ